MQYKEYNIKLYFLNGILQQLLVDNTGNLISWFQKFLSILHCDVLKFLFEENIYINFDYLFMKILWIVRILTNEKKLAN